MSIHIEKIILFVKIIFYMVESKIHSLQRRSKEKINLKCTKSNVDQITIKFLLSLEKSRNK